MATFGHTVEQVVRILGARRSGSEPVDAPSSGEHSLDCRREVEQQCARCSYRIVANAFNRKDGNPSVNDGGELTRVLEHLVVTSHEAGIAQLMESNNELSIIEFWKPTVDSSNGNEVDVRHEGCETIQDWLREVVIQRNVHSGGQLAFKLDCLTDSVE